MFASLLTTILFSLSVIFASRSAKLLGGTRANLARIVNGYMYLATRLGVDESERTALNDKMTQADKEVARTIRNYWDTNPRSKPKN